MQIIKSYFESENIKILAQLAGFGPDNSSTNYSVENNVMYSTPVSLYSGVNNPVRIQCLNSDQMRINVSNVSITAGLFQPGTQNELVTLNAANIDSANGIVSINFTPSDLAPLDFGFYEIALSAADNNGNAWPVYINDSFGNRLKTTLHKGPVFAYPDPVNLTFTDISHQGVTSNWIDLTNRPMNSTTATLQLEFLQEYNGNLTAQGTMVSSPQPGDFANISSVNYSNANGIIFQNVLGSFAIIQFVVDNIDPQGFGNVNIADWIGGANIRI